MHADSFGMTAQCAFVSVPLKRITPMQLPFLVVRGHLPATPKVALRSRLNLAQPSIAALHRACFLVVRQACFKSLAAYRTSSFFPKFAVSRKPIAPTRAVSGCWPTLFRVECVAALLAGAIFAQLWLSSRAFQSLIPRRWGRLCSVARRRTVLAFSRTFELYAACNTGVEYWFHTCIIPHVWLDERNIQLAHDRIGRSQPLLLAVTA